MNPLNPSQSLGQWAYTGHWDAPTQVVSAAGCAAAEAADCWADCMLDTRKQILAALSAAAFTPPLTILPKEFAVAKATEMGFHELAARMLANSAWDWKVGTTSGWRTSQLLCKEYFGKNSAMHLYFRGMANSVKAPGALGKYAGFLHVTLRIAGTVWLAIEGGMSLYCGEKCME